MANVSQTSLMVQGGPNSGITIPLTGRPVTLGRRPDNDVVVDETTVSRRHALILETPAGFVVRDLSTTNGTYVNQDRIDLGERLLTHGDRIRLAGSEVTFIFRQEGPSTIKITVDSPPTGMTAIPALEDLAQTTPEKPQPQREQPRPQLMGKDSDILRLLESKKGTIVSYEEITRHVWPELLESNLAKQVIDEAIERIRAQIEDDPLDPVHLITIRDAGFLLI